ncbi:hypothetical protein LguiA_005827 [Lonicera macranthoides]
MYSYESVRRVMPFGGNIFGPQSDSEDRNFKVYYNPQFSIFEKKMAVRNR